MGIGWNISGLSSITRGGSNMVDDGMVKGVKFDAGDYFYLDGNRLVATTGNYGVNSTEYTTQNASYAKVISHGGDLTNGPDWFEVKTSDGMVYEYGNSADSRIETIINDAKTTVVKEWLLYKVTNVEGFSMIYGYYDYLDINEKIDTKYGLPNVIKYSFKETTIDLQYYLYFIFTSRVDNFDVYREGDQRRNLNILTGIKITFGDNILSNYFFGYENGNYGTQYSHLNSIALHANEIKLINESYQVDPIISMVHYNPLEITWTDEGLCNFGTSTSQSGDFTVSDGYESMDRNPRYIGDFNGDGRSDILARHSYFNPLAYNSYYEEYNVALFSGTGFNQTSVFIDLPVELMNIDPTMVSRLFCRFYLGEFSDYKIGDVNGDGMDDIVAFYSKKTLFLLSTGTSFTISSISDDFIETNGWDDQNPMNLVDVNGDGRADIVGFGNDGVYVAISTGASFNSMVLWTTGFSNNDDWGEAEYSRMMADFNGDGMADIIGFGHDYTSVCLSDGTSFNYAFSTTAYSYSQGWGEVNPAGRSKFIRTVADVNGDGLSDIVGFGEDDVYVSLSTGISFTSGQMWSENMGFNDGGYRKYHHVDGLNNPALVENSDNEHDQPITSRMLADVNGDGKADLLGFDELRVHVELSTGTNFSNADNTWHTGYCYDASWTDVVRYPRMVGDFNGDGSMDIIGFGDTQFSFSLSSLTTSKVSKVTNSSNAEEYFDYKPLTSSEVYNGSASSNTYPYMTFNGSLYVLNKYSNSFSTKFSKYIYENATIHLQGRGFLGFKEVTEKGYESVGGALNYGKNSNFQLNTSFHTLTPWKIYITQNESYNYIEFDYHIENIAPSGSTYRIIRGYPLKALNFTVYYGSSQLNQSIRSELTTTSINSYGQPKVSTTYIANNAFDISEPVTSYNHFVKTEYTYKNITSPYILGLPLSVKTTTKTLGNADDIQLTEFVYYSTSSRRIYKIIQTPNSDNSLSRTTTIHSYDAVGNITAKTEGTTFSLLEYDLTAPYYGRFLTKRRTLLPSGGYGDEEFEYNPVIGTLILSKDWNQFVTTYQYNAFGERQITTNPDGTVSIQALRWANSDPPDMDAPTNALYYSWSYNSGSTPVKVFYNKYGQPLRTITSGFDGTLVFSDQEYINGKLTYDSDPYFKGGTPLNYRNYEYLHDNLFKVEDLNGYNTSETYGAVSIANYYDVNNTLIKSSESEQNFLGQLIRSSDAGGDITYQYFSNGKPKSVSYNQSTTTFEYDAAGNATVINDPNAGQILKTYDSFGRLIHQIDEKQINAQYQYDDLGRIISVEYPDINEVTTYAYDNAVNFETSNPPTTLGLIAEISLNAENFTHNYEYQYDKYNREAKTIENINTLEFSEKYSYDPNSRLIHKEFPSGLGINYGYNAQGYLNIINANDDKTIWEKSSSNCYDQTTQFELSSGKISVSHSYDAYGSLNNINAVANSTSIQDLTYNFDEFTGNLMSRMDEVFQTGEVFTYDNLDRLLTYTTIDNSNNPTSTTKYNTYDVNGNISFKTDVGNYFYGTEKPNAVKSIQNPVSLPNEALQTTSYNHFNKISTINHSTKSKNLQYYYNSSQQRALTVYTDGGNYREKYFTQGNYELELYNGQSRGLNYIYSPDGLVCVIEDDGNQQITSYNYLLNDHLGSLYAIVDEDGTYKQVSGQSQIFSFDPWGNRRSYLDWSQACSTTEFLLDRGFTGHQMLDEFGIIEMNGRIYDPQIARFFSPDPYIQAPNFSQSHNRYSYVMNNPLKYTDPSGYWAGWDDLIVGGVGFAFGYVSYGIMNGNWGWSAVGAGAMSAGAFMLGYYTAGAATASYGSIAAGFSAGGAQGAANTVALSYAGQMVASSAISSFMPSLTVPIGDNFSVSVSPALAFSPSGFSAGANISATYYSGDWTFTSGFGASDKGNTMFSGATYFDRANSQYFSYYATHFGGPHKQLVGGLGYRKGDFSFRFENDFFTQSGDKFRTNALEFGYRDFVIGTNLWTNDPAGEGSEVNSSHSRLWGKNWFGNGSWESGIVLSSPFYVGYRFGNGVTRIGIDHPGVQDMTQNFIHKYTYFGKQNYYNVYSHENALLYYQSGYYNPFTLY